MKLSSLAVKVVAICVALVLIQIALGVFITTAVPPPKNAGPWFLLSTLLVSLALSVLGMRSDWRGWRRAFALSAIPTVIMLNNYLEGVIFLTSTGISWPKEILRMCLTNALAMPVWFLVFRRNEPTRENYRPFTSNSGSQRLWKFAAVDLAYPILYFVAGTIIFPYVRDYYASQTLPPAGFLFLLQLLVRGPIYLGVCLVIVRMLGLPRRAGAVAAGLIFSTLSGIAPLIIPSGVFPEVVRLAHLWETAVSNFVFAALVAWLWGDHSLRENRHPGPLKQPDVA